ncbi:MAG: TIR domain-containing protein [Pseudomonadota bacterium]
MTESKSIFVSYSHENADWVERLRLHENPGAIERASFWVDLNRLKPTDVWTDEARAAIKESSAVILLVSEQSLASSAVEKELRLIMKRHRKHRLPVVFVPIGKLRMKRAARQLGIPNLNEVISVPGWHSPLNPRAGREVRSAADLRAQIVAAATEPQEVQNLRRNLPAKYNLIRKLNHGPLARILLAKDVPLNRHVVIKVLRKAGAYNLFCASVSRVARVPNHTNIIPIYVASLDSDPPFYMLEYINGKSLRQLLAGNTDDGFPLSLVLGLLRRIGSAVHHAHRHSVSGLNIKPSNIMVENPDRPDRRTFYISLSSYDESEIWEEHDVDDAYVPPELRPGASILHDSDATTADQYRLGVLAYELLVGPRRFAELTHDTLAKDPGAGLPLISEVCPSCLDYVGTVVDRMVSVEPSLRFATVREAIEHLDSDVPVEIVRSSYRRIMANEASQQAFFHAFYQQFQSRYKSSQAIFASKFGPLSDVDGPSDAWMRQFQSLKEAILLLIVYSAIGEEKREPNILTRIAEQHAHKNIPAGLYEPFGQVLVDTIVEVDEEGAELGERLRSAWTEAVRDGLEYMKTTTEKIQAGLL